MASPSTGGYDTGFGAARQAPPSGRPSRRGFLGAATAGAFGPAVLGAAPEAQAGAVREKEAAPAAPPRPVPGWFDEVKLGVFIHWNAAAIPAFAPVHLLNDLHAGDDADLPKWQQEQIWRTLPYAEMYQNTMAVPGSETSRFHAERYGNRPYDDFVEQFRTSSVRRWDPQSWADLFERAGAGYVVLTAKTEDGFLLWPSAHPNPRKKRWQSTRDVVGELAAAVRERGIRFGTYYCEGMDWTFGGIPITDGESLVGAMPQGKEYASYSDAHWRELISRYRPSVLWDDYGFLPNPDADALFRTYAQLVPDGVVNDRFDIVATGGNLLINVGPTGSGEIPAEQAERLLALGQWLRVNHEAIRGTRPWRRSAGVTTEGLPVRFTRAGDAVHAIVLGDPRGDGVDLDVRLDKRADVSLLGADGSLRWAATPHGTRVELPRRRAGRTAASPALSLRIAPASAVRDSA